MADDGGHELTPRLAETANRVHAAAETRRVLGADILRPPAARLSDERRSLLRGLIESLIDSVESDLVAHAQASGTRLQFESRPDPALRGRVAARLLADPALLAALFRRGGEHLIATRLRALAMPATEVPETLLHALARAADPLLAERAMAMLVAEARRQDAFGGPALPLDELDHDVGKTAVWQIAALVRHTLSASHLDADNVLQGAARRLLADHAPDRGLPLRTVRLANRLAQVGQDGDALWSDALRHGAVRLAAALAAARADLPPDLCLDLLAGDNLVDVAVLLRLARLGADAAEAALTLLAEVGDLEQERAVAVRLYRTARDSDLAEIAMAWRRDPAFAAALAGFPG